MIVRFQINQEKDSLEILFDKEGLDYLIQLFSKTWKEPFSKTKDLFDLDHEHLMSKEWGGNELNTDFVSKGNIPIHSVKIVYLGEDGKTVLA